MIIKNLSWHRFDPKSLLEYIEEEEKILESEHPIHWNILPGSTHDEVLEAFKHNHSYRNLSKKNLVMLHHDIISFSPEDKSELTPDKLRDLTFKYLDLRAKRNLAFAQIHKDKGHYHVHIMISPNPSEESRVTQISRKEYFQIRRDLETYQIETYPELSNSVVFLGQSKDKERVNNKAFEIQKRNGVLDRDQITELISSAYKSSSSLEEFHTLAQQINGAKLYIRGGRYYGIEYEGRKYRFTTLLKLSHDEIEKGLSKKEKSIVDDLIAKAGTRTKERTASRDNSDDYEIEL